MKKIVLVCFILIGFVLQGAAKTKKFGSWIELEFNKEIIKNLEFSIIPEIRLQDDFSVDEYMVDAKFGFEPIKNINFAAAYRINNNIKKKGNEITNRWVFDAKGSKEFGRFEGTIRLRYTNYSEDQEGVKKANYFRPRIKFQYDIKKNKITPFVSYEIFRNLAEKEFQKSRFDVGASRKIGKVHRVSLYYRLQDYWASTRNSINIFGVDYRLKF